MQVQIHAGGKPGDHRLLVSETETAVTASLSRFGERITRVEVHLTDTNSDQKSGADDKRCVLEVRLAGLDPVAVTHNAPEFGPAVHGAIDKVKRVLDRTLGRLGHG